MRPYEEMTDERRCEAGAGLHYKSREWDEIFNAGGGWDGAWPEIDRHGKLTGRIVGSEDGYLNVNDEAMISEAEARAGGWTSPDDGYAEPPEPTEPTRQQIAALEAEAAQHGDLLMAAICRVAAGRDHAAIPLDDDERNRVDAMTADDALAEVARCLSEAAAQRDD